MCSIMKYRMIIRVSFIILVSLNCLEASTIVDTPDGKVRGKVINSTRVFRGIPFAEAPVGDRRFRPPQPILSPWSDVKDTTEFGASCSQLLPGGRPAWNSINISRMSEGELKVVP